MNYKILLSFLIISFSILFVLGCNNIDKDLKNIGEEKFSNEKWLISDFKERGKMAYDLVKSNLDQICYMDHSQIEDLLGKDDTYVMYDVNRGYKISENEALAFSFTKKGVDEVFIYIPKDIEIKSIKACG